MKLEVAHDNKKKRLQNLKKKCLLEETSSFITLNIEDFIKIRYLFRFLPVLLLK